MLTRLSLGFFCCLVMGGSTSMQTGTNFLTISYFLLILGKKKICYVASKLIIAIVFPQTHHHGIILEEWAMAHSI